MTQSKLVQLAVDATGKITKTIDGVLSQTGEIKIPPKGKITFYYERGFALLFVGYTPAGSKKKRTLKQRATKYNGETPGESAAYCTDGGGIVVHIKDTPNVEPRERYDYSRAGKGRRRLND